MRIQRATGLSLAGEKVREQNAEEGTGNFSDGVATNQRSRIPDDQFWNNRKDETGSEELGNHDNELTTIDQTGKQ